MGLLNIFQHADGTTAWDTLFVIFIAILAGWLLHRFYVKRKEDNAHRKAIAEWEVKYKRLESDYKNYRSNIATSEKHNDKALVELNGRVKGLEGDIRALADEKNKIQQRIVEKEEEIRRLLRQLGEKDDLISEQKEHKAKIEGEWAEKLRQAEQALSRALSWEEKARKAEADANKARETVGAAERKKLEAELRLKSVSDYAGKVGPLEQALAEKEKIIAALQEQLRLTERGYL